MTTTMKFNRCLVVSLVSVVVLLSTSGCKGGFGTFKEIESSPGFKLLTVENVISSYQLDYSDFYKRSGPSGDLEVTGPYSSVLFIAPKKSMQLLFPKDRDSLKTVSATYVPASISIYVYDPSNYTKAPKDAKERVENDIGDNAKWENFELQERTSVTISGIKGELIGYVKDWFIPVPRGNQPLLEYHRAAYFDYNNRIWVIEAKSELGMVDQVNADFDHIIQTFKVLE